MKYLFYILAVTLLSAPTFGQINFKRQVDSLRFVVEMPYICEGQFAPNNNLPNCGDILFWKVVILKDSVIPLLIDRLDDTTTTPATVPNFGYNYTVADIAYVALEEIIHGIPTFKLLGIKFDTKGCGYCSYWQYLNKSSTNRQKFKKAVQKWYDNNKANLIWVSSNDFSSCDCRGQHPNGGHYQLQDK